ncbi:hypothetical protein C3L33_10563, partial [Rhododendron williamsianum]
LEVLDVSHCKGITEEGIADFLKSGSKIRKLRIVGCWGIKNIGNGFELSELDFIGAAKSGINDDGLVVIGNRCQGLLNLDLGGCLGVTTVMSCMLEAYFNGVQKLDKRLMDNENEVRLLKYLTVKGRVLNIRMCMKEMIKRVKSSPSDVDKIVVGPSEEDAGNVHLEVIADTMPCLEDLDMTFPLSGGSVTDRGIEVLSSKLKGMIVIAISGNELLTDKSLIALSTNCVYLTHIHVLDCSLVTPFGIEFVLRNSTNLSVLSVSEIDFGQLDDYSIRCARNLSDLTIYDSVVPDEYLHLLAKSSGIPLKGFTLSLEFQPMSSCFTFCGISSLLNKYRSLTFLSLAAIDFLTDEKMSDLSQCLSALDTIWLNTCIGLTESTFFTLAKNCPLLEDISMQETNLGGGGGGGGDKAADIVKNPRIKFLNLENNPKLSDECLAKLALRCPSLEVLDVSSCKDITGKGIADFLKSSSKIMKLQINECGGIMNIGNGFELSELEVLGAARSGINDDGLVAIGNRHGKLLELNLNGCLGVTIVGLEEILRNCKRLRKMDLTSCFKMSTDMIDQMVFSRPSLRKIILSVCHIHLCLLNARGSFYCAVDVLFCQGWRSNSSLCGAIGKMTLLWVLNNEDFVSVITSVRTL